MNFAVRTSQLAVGIRGLPKFGGVRAFAVRALGVSSVQALALVNLFTEASNLLCPRAKARSLIPRLARHNLSGFGRRLDSHG